MIESLLDYWKTQLKPRARTSVLSSEVVIALIAGVAVGVWGARVGLGRARSGDVVVAILAYAAVAFGFCVAALTIALTTPRERMAARLATLSRKHPKVPLGVDDAEKDAYSDLLYVFSSTAVANWLLILGSVALLVALGTDLPFLPRYASTRHHIAAGLFAAVTIYAIEMFLVTVLTLSALGDVHIANLREDAPRILEPDCEKT